MPDPVSGLVVAGGSLLGGLANSHAQRGAAKDASQAQLQAAQLGIDEERRQFDKVQALLAPFVSGGSTAFDMQGDLLGVGGAEKQGQAISALESSPRFQSLVREGENSILQNASATGGLRGGNVQGALARFRPQMLEQLIQQQFGNLGSLAGVGQASAAGTAAAAQNTGAAVSSLLGQQGAARAGYSLAKGQAQQDLYGNILQSVGMLKF